MKIFLICLCVASSGAALAQQPPTLAQLQASVAECRTHMVDLTGRARIGALFKPGYEYCSATVRSYNAALSAQQAGAAAAAAH